MHHETRIEASDFESIQFLFAELLYESRNEHHESRFMMRFLRFMMCFSVRTSLFVNPA